MKKRQLLPMGILAGIIISLSVPALAFVGENPDFTGKWTLSEEKSKLGEGMFFAAVELKVGQEGATLRLDRTRSGRDGQMRTMSEELVTDGTKNVTERENGSTTAVATWSEDGTALKIMYEIVFNRQGETFTMQRSEVWTMDGTGKLLTIESSSTSPRGESSVTLVYDKQ